MIGTLISIPLSSSSMIGASAFFISSVAIDMDHFIFYWFHQRAFFLYPRKFLLAYEKWSYFGPRVHIFHNYEMVLLLVAIAWIYGGLSWYWFAGALVHLICDQAESYKKFRFMRVRTFVGDILRYREYLHASRQSLEQEYMISRRDSWWNHLKTSLSDEQFIRNERHCGIFEIYPEIPIDKSNHSGTWKGLL